MIVQPGTVIRWQLPRNLRDLIAQMVHQNSTWGQNALPRNYL